MRNPPVAIASLQLVAALTWSTALVMWNGGAPGTVLALDLLLLAIVAVVGLVLTHGRWARNLAGSLIGYEALLAVTGTIEPIWWIGVVASAGAAIGLGGPWLQSWLRRFPRADGPPVPAVLAPLAMLAMPTAVAVSHPIGVVGWLLIGVSLLGAWSYARAHLVTLWGLRVAYLPLAVWAAWDRWPNGFLIVGLAAAIAGLLWTRAAFQATRDLEPRRVHVKPVLPEMAPAEILDHAGYDERGRKRS